MDSRLHSGLLFMLMEWLLTMELSSGFKTGYYGGYNFTVSFSSNDSLKKYDKYDAQNWCRTNGAQLVEITSSDVQNAMASFLSSISYNSASIITGGIRNYLQGWRRLNGSDTGGLSIGGQNDATYLYAYLTKSNGYTITAARSTDQRNGYICEGETSCSGSNGFVVDSWCYTAYAYGPSWYLSWFDARMQCISKGGDLASFYPITNNQQLNRLNGSWLSSSSSYWIGFRNESWIWDISRVEMKYTNWATGQPVQYASVAWDCMCVVPSEWKWQTCRCGDTSQLICYSGSQTSTSTTSTTTTKTTTTTTKTTTLSVPPSFGGASAATAYPSNRSSDGITRSSSDISSTSDSTSDHLRYVEIQQHADQKRAIAIGVGVGVGVGIGAVALIIVVIVIIYRRCPSTKFQTTNQASNSDATEDANSNHPNESNMADPYERLRVTQPETVYQQLQRDNNSVYEDL